jgi:hypothetical protein
MVKMLTAHTFEVDDADAAVSEILAQLDLPHKLKKNAVGIVFCYLDFINTGVVETLKKALPFDVIGSTTHGAAMPGILGDIILTLAVLTSDDVEFRPGLSAPLTEDAENRITRCYRDTAASLRSPPSMILVITPSLYNLAGDMVVGVLDRESRGVPVFGAGALDADTKIRTPKTIYGGTAYADRMPILLFAGNLKPRFFLDSVWDHDVHTQRALVTEAEGNRMISVNHIPAAAYMKKIGLISEERMDLLFVFPLGIKTEDGESTLCIIYGINGDGSVTCSANIPSGCTLSIGSPGSGEVRKTAEQITAKLKQQEGGEAALIFSCFSRSVVLANPHDEMETVWHEMEHSSLPYLFIYAGGEICPEAGREGKAVNRYHNYTIISCLFAGADKQEGEGYKDDQISYGPHL